VAFVLEELLPLSLFLDGHIPIAIDQGFKVFKIGSVKNMGAKF
jgi:hypothetical protein